jgi:hypothetical protein
MNFGPDRAEAIAEGRKTVTRRMPSDNPRSPWSREGCALKVGQRYAVCPGRGKHAIAWVRVSAVDLEPLAQRFYQPVSKGDAEAQREGFETVADFIERWKQLHGEWHGSELVWRIEFELMETRNEGAPRA